MKSIYLLLSFSTLLLFASCDNKDQKTLNKLDGTWQIKKLTHLAQDTTKLPTSGTISFNKCDVKDASNCPGTYSFNAQQTSELNFTVFEKGKELGIFHVGNFSTYRFSDKYKIVQNSDNRLELEGNIIVFREQPGANPTNKLVKVGIVLER